jgi:histidinol-phosphate phosphatase family protein
MQQAVFLDRDGTLIEDRGYLKDPRDAVFIPGVIDTLRLLQRRFVLFIVTNQSGIAKGLTTRQEVARVNGDVLHRLHQQGICIRECYVCPHAKEHCCKCHKPEPEFAHDAARRYGLDLAASWSVGDHPHDAELGVRAGGRGVHVLTGHGPKHRAEVKPGTPIAATLMDAARIMLVDQR